MMPNFYDQSAMNDRSPENDFIKIYATNNGTLPSETQFNFESLTFERETNETHVQLPLKVKITELIIRFEQLKMEEHPLYIFIVG